jgi:hypothetical protein
VGAVDVFLNRFDINAGLGQRVYLGGGGGAVGNCYCGNGKEGFGLLLQRV